MSDSRVHDITFAIHTGGVGSVAAQAPRRPPYRIDHNTVTNACSDAIGVHSGQNNRVDSNRLEHVGIGVDICCAQAAVENSARGNTVVDAQFGGIAVLDSAGQVTGNTIDGSGDTGIFIAGGSADLLVAGNGVTHTQQAGVDIEPCCSNANHPTDIHLIGNIVTATADSLRRVRQQNDDEIRGNTVTRSGGFGDPGSFGVGLVVDFRKRGDRRPQHVLEHTRTRNRRRAPRRVRALGITITDNIVRRNTVIEAGNDGILVSPVTHDTTLDHNVAERGAADGIHVLGLPADDTRSQHRQRQRRVRRRGDRGRDRAGEPSGPETAPPPSAAASTADSHTATSRRSRDQQWLSLFARRASVIDPMPSASFGTSSRVSGGRSVRPSTLLLRRKGSSATAHCRVP